jgi:hypothetical protein
MDIFLKAFWIKQYFLYKLWWFLIILATSLKRKAYIYSDSVYFYENWRFYRKPHQNSCSGLQSFLSENSQLQRWLSFWYCIEKQKEINVYEYIQIFKHKYTKSDKKMNTYSINFKILKLWKVIFITFLKFIWIYSIMDALRNNLQSRWQLLKCCNMHSEKSFCKDLQF